MDNYQEAYNLLMTSDVIDESVNGLYYKGFRLEKGKKYKVLPGDQIGIGSMQCVITVGAR